MEDEHIKKINMTDHDLLVTMHEQIKGIKGDIKEIKDGTAAKLEDLEKRMREVEKFKENWNGRNVVIGVILMFLIGLLGNYFSNFL